MCYTNQKKFEHFNALAYKKIGIYIPVKMNIKDGWIGIMT